jgi:hypothetical protein
MCSVCVANVIGAATCAKTLFTTNNLIITQHQLLLLYAPELFYAVVTGVANVFLMCSVCVANVLLYAPVLFCVDLKCENQCHETRCFLLIICTIT